MQQDLGIGLGAVALVVGFPLLLMCLLWLLGRLEAWMLEPDERAAVVTRLLEQVDEAEEVERAVTRLMARVADRPVADRPVGDRPVGDRPVGDRPAGDRPVGDRPAGDRPAGDRPDQRPGSRRVG